MANINCTISVELSTIATDLVLLILGFQNLVVGEYHTVNPMTYIGTLPELAQPLRPFLVDHLLEFKISSVKI